MGVEDRAVTCVLPEVSLVHRYYDPATGSFLSVDPTVQTTEQPYSYAGNDPVNVSDPSGDFPGHTLGLLCLGTCTNYSSSRTFFRTVPRPGCTTGCGVGSHWTFTHTTGALNTTRLTFTVTGGDPLYVYVIDFLEFPDTTFNVCAEPRNDCQQDTLVFEEGMRVKFPTQDSVATSGDSGRRDWVGHGFQVRVTARVDPLPAALSLKTATPPAYGLAVGSWSSIRTVTATEATKTTACGSTTSNTFVA